LSFRVLSPKLIAGVPGLPTGGSTPLPQVMTAAPDSDSVSPFFRFPATAVVLLLSAGACSPDSGSDAIDQTAMTNLAFNDRQDAQATTSTMLIDGAPVVALAEGDLDYVQFEAVWVCELQRRTFATPDAIDAARLEKLADLGLDVDIYNDFWTRVNADQALRDSILFAYQETCQP
jgi:hypothetical protein